MFNAVLVDGVSGLRTPTKTNDEGLFTLANRLFAKMLNGHSLTFVSVSRTDYNLDFLIHTLEQVFVVLLCLRLGLNNFSHIRCLVLSQQLTLVAPFIVALDNDVCNDVGNVSSV